MILVLGALVVVNLYVFVWDQKTGVRAIRQQAEAAGTGPTMAIPAAPLAPAPAPVPEPAAGSAAGKPAPSVTVATKVIEGKVGKSETIGKMLKKNGLSAAEADEIIRAMSGVIDFKTIRAGESFEIQRGPDGRVGHFQLDLGKGKRVRVERQPTGELAAHLAET